MKKSKIKISGFTFIKNAIEFDYPAVESILSILPLVDEMIVNVGKSQDDTLELIRSIKSPHQHKIRIIEREWPKQFTEKSRVLAMQTNIALYECQYDWCFYIQADELFHVDDTNLIRKTLEQVHDNKEVEGILFDYVHFFGNYHWYGSSSNWYRKEIRLIRNHIGVTSYKDAQGFRLDCKKLKVIDSGARIHHYGWVRLPEKMEKKKQYHDSLHHRGDKREKLNKNFRYENFIDPKALKPFKGTHPELMAKRIKNYSATFDPQEILFRPRLKDIRKRIVDFIGRRTGVYLGEYRNYRIIKNPTKKENT